MLDIEAMAEKIAAALFAKMKEGFAKRDARIAELETAIAALPIAKDGKDAEPVDYARVEETIQEYIGKVAAGLSPGKDGKDGKDGANGKDGESIAPEFVADLVAKAVVEIPVPANGRDGKDGADGKDGESIAPEFVADLVAKAVAEIPVPANGSDGKDGTSVTLADVEPLIAQEVSKAVSATPIPKDGKSVTVDDVRPLILGEIEKAVADIPAPRDGQDGLPGVAGQNGQDGEPGQAGRDAIELEILPEIDQTRTYSRGTYVQHNNGLWRSFETTDGMKGWECLISGIASVDVVNENEREFTIKIVNSDGTVTQKTFSLPVMIYRGGLVDGKGYLAGDVVTWAGHTWHCNQPTAEKPIEGGKAWTMCVRRGRDGKEGPQGLKGADGRNLQAGARA